MYAVGMTLANGQLLARRQQRDAAAQAAQAAANRDAVLTTVNPHWLAGRWVSTDGTTVNCIDGPRDEFQPRGRFAGYESAGSWMLNADQLKVVGEDEGENFTPTSTIIAAGAGLFTERQADGRESTYRRCTRDEMRAPPVSTPPESAAPDIAANAM